MLSVVAHALRFLYPCVCRFLPLSSGDAIGGRQWEVQALSAGIHARAYRWCRVPKKVSPLGRGDDSCDVELYASAKMFASA
jgi:hypothetical protein